MKSQARKSKVFISHTKDDKDFARRLANDIESFGIPVWFDEREIQLGDSILERIEQGIIESKWMIVILSPQSIKSEWVNRELRSGLSKEIGDQKVFVLPVLYKEIELPPFVRDKFYADCTGSYEDGLKIIKDRLVGSYESSSSDEWLLIKRPRISSENGIYGITVGDFNNNTRSFLHDNMVHLRKEIALKNHSESAFKNYELWFGRTGRLALRSTRNRIFGHYDWLGKSLAGRIEGEVRNNVISFSWSWSKSSEKGRGLFWTSVPNILFGGWWMDYDDINEENILSGKCKIENSWEFANIQGMNVSLI